MSSFAIRAEIDGLDHILRALSQLKKQAARSRVLRKALGPSTKPFMMTAKQLAPKETGLLRKSIGRKIKVYRESGRVTVIIGPRSKPSFRREVTINGRTQVRNPVHYAHLVEFGTVKTRAKPFLRPAVDRHKEQFKVTFKRLVLQGILDELKKVKK